VAETVLHGRDAELARLDAALAELGCGRTGTVVVTGEAGIGKTALLAELARRADARGWLVLEGRGTEFERDEPFALFAGALDAYLAADPDPDLRDPLLHPLVPSWAGPGGSVDRLQLHAAVRALLGRLSRRRPLLLVLDDLHWADPASIDLVGYLLRHRPEPVTLLAAALRPAQAPDRLRVATDPAGAPDLLHLPLGPLGPDDVARLVGCPAEAAAHLHADSGGNPLYALALAQAPAGVPAAVTDVLTGQMSALPEPARTALRSAAVAGDPFEVGLAARIADLTDPDFRTVLDRLVVAGMVVPTEMPRAFRFRHPVVRHAVRAGAGPGWLIGAHARAAATLATAGAPPQARAHHVEQSAAPGDEEAVAVLTAAGHAAAGHAPAAAAHWFAAALRLLPAPGNDAARTRRAGLLLEEATAAGAAGRFNECRAAVDELLTLAPPAMADARAQLVAFRAFVDHLSGRLDDARDLVRRELARLAPDAVAARSALRIELATDALLRNDHAALAEHAEAALGDAERAGGSALLAAAAVMCAIGHYHGARVRAARLALDRAATLVDATADAKLAAHLDVVPSLALAECNLERYTAAIAHADRALRLADTGGRALMLPALHAVRGLANAHLGRIDAALADTATAYEASMLTGSAWTASAARGLSSWLHIWIGDLDVALAHADEASRIGAEISSGFTTSNTGLFRAEALVEVGRGREAIEVLLTACGGPDLPLLERPWRGRARQTLVRAALSTGDLPAARDWLARGRAEIAGVPLPTRQANVDLAAAALALAEGNPVGAAAAASTAVAATQAAGTPVETGRARVLLGVALAGRGEPAAGLAELNRAARDLDALGAHRYRDAAIREMRRLGRRHHRTPRPGRPGVLSPREDEVAELVARGRTNRQIAEQLVISERTVETHVSRILGKLRVESRAAVGTALAARSRSR
jgi:ATP/maltotriose-dependent transcriptional regulator MalT